MATSCVQLCSASGARVDGVERAAAGGVCWRGPSWAWPPGQSRKGQGSGQSWPGLLLGARRVDTSWHSHSHLPHLPPQLSIFSRSELAQQTLAEASAELQRRFAPRISKRAQELFGRLTAMRYDRLTLAGDLSLMVSADREDTLRSSLWRSDGTVDQLYLALRLAVAEELTPDAPLILDDALVRFDDKRLAAALEILSETAENKQVILFTCQSREKSTICKEDIL